MASVTVTTVKKNVYKCVVVFKHNRITYSVDYTLTLSVEKSDFIKASQQYVDAEIDFNKLANRILIKHSYILNPKPGLVDEVAEALSEALPRVVTWDLT